MLRDSGGSALMAKLRKSSPAAHPRNSKPLADRFMMRTLSISILGKSGEREAKRAEQRQQGWGAKPLASRSLPGKGRAISAVTPRWLL